jgi:hypothetical protein
MSRLLIAFESCYDPIWRLFVASSSRLIIIAVRLVSVFTSNNRYWIIADLGCSIVSGLFFAYIYNFSLLFIIPTLLFIALSILMLVPEEVLFDFFEFFRFKRNEPVEPLELAKVVLYPMPTQDQTERSLPLPMLRQSHEHEHDMQQVSAPPPYDHSKN